jgi:hypothetical protein
MAQARKIMELNTETNRTNKDYIKMYEAIPKVSFEEAVTRYKADLATWCKEFNVASVRELMMKADNSEIPMEISGKVLMYVSFLERNSISLS